MLFTIYANFKSILRRVERAIKDSNISYAKKYQEHIPCSFVYYYHRSSKPVVLYRGKKAANSFMTEIRNKYKYCSLEINIEKEF